MAAVTQVRILVSAFFVRKRKAFSGNFPWNIFGFPKWQSLIILLMDNSWPLVKIPQVKCFPKQALSIKRVTEVIFAAVWNYICNSVCIIFHTLILYNFENVLISMQFLNCKGSRDDNNRKWIQFPRTKIASYVNISFTEKNRWMPFAKFLSSVA